MIDWRPFFPEANVRPLQGMVLDLVFANWDHFDNFSLELPTGVGKSAVALTIARTVRELYKERDHLFTEDGRPTYQPNFSYITTTNRDLQAQYMASYEKLGLHMLYSADHYKCHRGDLTCGDGRRLNPGHSCAQCPYATAKQDFIDSYVGIVNMAYYINETYYAHQLCRRGVLIMDEAHTVGEWVREFVSVEITAKQLAGFLLTPPKSHDGGWYNIEHLIDWMVTKYIPREENYLSELRDQMKSWIGSDMDPKFVRLCKEHSEADNRVCKLHRIVDEVKVGDWIGELDGGNIRISPLKCTPFIRDVLTGLNDKNVMLSATILDQKFMIKEYDMDPERTMYFSAGSPFPKENRPIYYLPVGKLNHEDLRKSTAPFADAVNAILMDHPNERGIIFASSYAQVRELMDQCNNSRLITHDGSAGKSVMMDRHKASKNTVIVSPSMAEGVDLKDDLSRFQIVLKIPYPSLGSKVVYARKEMDPDWYLYKTCLTLVQSTGRSVRSDTDHAVTYVLDTTFPWVHSKWGKFLPKYWKEAVIM